MNIDSKVTFALDVCFQVGHLVVIIHPVDHKIGEPRILSGSLKQLVKQFQTLLSKVVSEDFEGHQSAVVEERLGE